jgi:glycine/D-amino acid oxidase-like deaminating enzyme
VTVEVFPRAHGSTLITAFSDEAPLPLDPAAVTPDPSAIDRLQAICEWLSPMLRAERIIARQACVRPVTQDGLLARPPLPKAKIIHRYPNVSEALP